MGVSTPTLDIVIVNWNSSYYLRECLTRLACISCNGFFLRRVIVVDNASTDGSLDGLESLPLPLIIIKNAQNYGFAKACNQGARGSKANYLLFLNPDVRLFEHSLSVPVTFMERPENERVGVVGIQLVDEAGAVSRTCARFPTPRMFFVRTLGLDKLFPRLFHSYFMVEWDHGTSRKVDHVTGAFFLVRRVVFESLGGFDERFFVYLEDLDFSLRTRRAGWSSFYLAEAQAYHKAGGTSEQVRAVRLFYSLRSRIHYAYKHFGWGAATGVAVATLCLEPITRLVWAIARVRGLEVVETLKGYLMLWRAAPRILRDASRLKRNEDSAPKPI